MFLYLFLVVTLIPIAELYLLIQVGDIVGFWNTLGIILLTGLLGAAALKSQGREVLKTLNSRLRSGEFPSEAIVGGVLVFVGGIFLVTPGFLTDGLGFLLLLPFTRRFFSSFLKKGAAKMFRFGNVEVYTYSGNGWQEVNPEFTNQKPQPQKPADIIDISSFRREPGSLGSKPTEPSPPSDESLF